MASYGVKKSLVFGSLLRIHTECRREASQVDPSHSSSTLGSPQYTHCPAMQGVSTNQTRLTRLSWNRQNFLSSKEETRMLYRGGYRRIRISLFKWQSLTRQHLLQIGRASCRERV